MSVKNYHFKHLATEQDHQIAKELFGSCFAVNNSYFNHYQSIEKQLAFNPAISPENYWLIWQENTVIGATQIFTFPIRMGIATLQLGGIGGVCTLPAFRRQGYNEALLTHCLEQMQQLGHDLSLLGGIPDYYHRFGYAVVMPSWQIKFSSQPLLKFSPAHDIRKFTPEDLPLLQHLFEQEFSELDGTHVRSTEFWQYQFKLNPVIYLAENQAKQPVGYIWLETRDQIRIKEAAAQTAMAATSLLQFVAREAQPRFQPEISGNLHPEQAFLRFLYPLCDFSITSYHRSNGGWMARVMNLIPAFQKLAPELSRLLQKSNAEMHLNVGFRTELGDLVLACHAGQVQVSREAPSHGFIELSQSVLAQMIYGYHHFTDLIAYHGLKIPPVYLPLLQILFPKKKAFLGEPDHF